MSGFSSFSISLAIFLALGLTLAYDIFIRRTIKRDFLVIFIFSIFSVTWNYLQLKAYQSTLLGEELRHGEYVNLVFHWQYLFFIAFIPLIFRRFKEEGIFVSALFLSSLIIGMLCDSFYLGDRLWLRGAVIFAWPITIFLAITFVQNFFEPFSCNFRSRLFIEICLIISMVIFLIHTLRPSSPTWQGFMEREKWQMFDWINRNLPKSSIIASQDIEDAFFLPIYTNAKPLYSMYGLTNRTLDDELKRYFFTMRLYGQDKNMLESILKLNQEDINRYYSYVFGAVPRPYNKMLADPVIFIELLTYHEHNKSLSNAFKDPAKHKYMEKLFISNAKAAMSLKYEFDFAIINNKEMPSWFLQWSVAYKNGHYSILKNPNSSASRI